MGSKASIVMMLLPRTTCGIDNSNLHLKTSQLGSVQLCCGLGQPQQQQQDNLH
jgi:hypothetical protein